MAHDDLTFDNVMKILEETDVSQDRTAEFYAVAQLLARGELSPEQQKVLGAKLVENLERDNRWRSSGAFNDE